MAHLKGAYIKGTEVLTLQTARVLCACDAMQRSDGGSRSQRMVAQWPALQGRKISQTVFTLEPCAMRPPHVHPRATGLLYVVSGGAAPTGLPRVPCMHRRNLLFMVTIDWASM